MKFSIVYKIATTMILFILVLNFNVSNLNSSEISFNQKDILTSSVTNPFPLELNSIPLNESPYDFEPIIEYGEINNTFTLDTTSAINVIDWNMNGTKVAIGLENSSLIIGKLFVNQIIIEKTINFVSGVKSIAWHPANSSTIVVSLNNAQITCIDFATNSSLWTISEPISVSNLKFNYGGDKIAYTYNKYISVRNSNNGSLIRTMEHPASVNALSWNSVNDYLASGGSGASFNIWDVSVTDPITTISFMPYSVWALSWNIQGSEIYLGVHDNKNGIRIVNLEDEVPQIRTLGDNYRVYSVSKNLRENLLTVLSDNDDLYPLRDREIDFYNISDSSKILTLNAHASKIADHAWNPMHEILVSGSTLGVLKLWEPKHIFSLTNVSNFLSINQTLDFSYNNQFTLNYKWNSNLYQSLNNNSFFMSPNVPGLNTLTVKLENGSKIYTKEYQFFQIVEINDFDGDGMENDWELNFGFNLLDPSDALTDLDTDGLINIIEFQIGTLPNNSDTDSDNILDGYEYNNNLDPLNDDSNLDKDLDGMPNWFESLYSLIANDSSDATQDVDLDGLTNLQEFQFGTLINKNDTDGDTLSDKYEFDQGLSGINNDTDGDGILDGYEVLNNLNPKEDDSFLDFDSDGLSNLVEFEIGTSANNNDTDHDGYSDKIEYDENTNPLDPNDYPGNNTTTSSSTTTTSSSSKITSTTSSGNEQPQSSNSNSEINDEPAPVLPIYSVNLWGFLIGFAFMTIIKRKKL